MPAKPLIGFRVLYFLAVTAWLLLTLVGVSHVVRGSFAVVEAAFHRDAEAVSAELRDKLKANEAVLAGFSSFLSAVGVNDQPGVQRYANLMLVTYPHIYMLEVVREVRREDRHEFEHHFQATWGRQFTIRTFSYESARNWSPASDKPVYQPIVFIWPDLAKARPVIGMDMDSVPHLREPLIEAKTRAVAIASKPFQLVEGDDAYVMFRQVDRSEQQAAPRPGYIFAGPLTAMLVMKTGALMPSIPAPMTAYWLQITRNGEPIEPPLYDLPAQQPSTDLERKVFPALRLQTNDYGTSQPMQLTVERQIRVDDLDAAGLTVMTVFSLLSLGLLVTYLHGHSANIEKALELEQQAEYLALHDQLTGLPNRRLLHDRVGQALAAWRRHGVGFALVFVDIDKFKEINDRNGHAIGDQLLCAMSARIAGAVREIDTVARYGGDEFIVLVSEVPSGVDLDTVCGKIQSAIAPPFEFEGTTLSVTASLGLSRCPQDGEDFQALLRRADGAMYGMKHDPDLKAQ